jgi:hypothetical protein
MKQNTHNRGDNMDNLKEVTFSDPSKLAFFLMELEERGATYKVINDKASDYNYWTVVLTGGF